MSDYPLISDHGLSYPQVAADGDPIQHNPALYNQILAQCQAKTR